MGRSCSLVSTLVMMTSCLTYLAKSDVPSAPAAVSTMPGHPVVPQTLPLEQQRQQHAQKLLHLQHLSDKRARDQGFLSSLFDNTPQGEARYSPSRNYNLPSPYQPPAMPSGFDDHQPSPMESLLAEISQAYNLNSLGEDVLLPSPYSLPQRNSLTMTHRRNLRPRQLPYDLLLLFQAYRELFRGLDSSFLRTQKSHLSKGKRVAPKFVGKRDVSRFGTTEFRLNPDQFSWEYNPTREIEYTQTDFPVYSESKRRAPKFIGKRRLEQTPANGRFAAWVLKRKAPKFVGRRRAPFFVGKRDLALSSNYGAPSPADVYYEFRRAAPKFVGKRAHFSTGGPEEKTLSEFDDRLDGSYFEDEDKRGAPKFVGKRSVSSFGRTLDHSSKIEKRSPGYDNHISRLLEKVENRIGIAKRATNFNDDFDGQNLVGNGHGQVITDGEILTENKEALYVNSLPAGKEAEDSKNKNADELILEKANSINGLRR